MDVGRFAVRAMSDRETPPVRPGRGVVTVWLQLLGLLAAVGLFGWIILRLSIMLHR